MEKWYVKDWHTQIEIRCGRSVVANLDSSYFTLNEDEANANLIVKAVNCHDGLVQALRTVIVHPQPVIVPTLTDAQCRGELYRLCKRVDHFKDIANKALAKAEVK